MGLLGTWEDGRRDGGLTLRSSCLNRVRRKTRWKERKRWENEER